MATFGAPWRWGIVIACAGVILLLLGAVTGRLPAGHFTLLRGAVCVVTFCLMVLAYRDGCPGWAILFGLTAFLFNPLLPIRMRRVDWRHITIGATVLLAAAAVRFGRTRGH